MQESLRYDLIFGCDIYEARCTTNVRINSFRSALPILEHRARPHILTAGGIVSLINGYRLSRRKPLLGFLNPSLVVRNLFNDITSGTNPGCDTDGFHRCQ